MGALYQFRTEDLLALERILDAADSVLDLALHLIGLAFAFRLLVAGHLPNDFFHFAFPLFQGTFHAVSVDHKVTPQCGVSQRERAELPERSTASRPPPASWTNSSMIRPARAMTGRSMPAGRGTRATSGSSLKPRHSRRSRPTYPTARPSTRKAQTWRRRMQSRSSWWTSFAISCTRKSSS